MSLGTGVYLTSTNRLRRCVRAPLCSLHLLILIRFTIVREPPPFGEYCSYFDVSRDIYVALVISGLSSCLTSVV